MAQPTNEEVAAIFLRMGDLMDYQEQGVFKTRFYWQAAEVLYALEEPLAEIAARRQLEQLPAVGKVIAGMIEEILATGTCAQYERLKEEVPPGIRELLTVPGLSPRVVRTLHQERGISSWAELKTAARGDLQGVPNLSVNDHARILRAIFDEKTRHPIDASPEGGNSL